tara:strand:- start:1240 stop:1470 length:231 start_codon:yes stop_codon:yes gene_type:complete
MDYSHNIDREEIKYRARLKAFSKMIQCQADALSAEQDLKQRLFGSLDEDQMLGIVQMNNIEKKIWEYIVEILEKHE